MGKAVGVNELARHLATNREGIARLVEQGVIMRQPDGKYDIDDCRVAYLKHLRERKAVVSPERARFEQARAQREEMKARKLAGELCWTRDLNDAWVALIGYIVAGLVAIPARCTRDVALRRTIEAELDAWRTDVANEFERRASELHWFTTNRSVLVLDRQVGYRQVLPATSNEDRQLQGRLVDAGQMGEFVRQGSLRWRRCAIQMPLDL
jgi:phage terminase Nu1 subunit (DNA packaging protein)